MKKYCAIYLGTKAGMEKWKKLDDATRKQREQQGMKAWQDWATTNKAAIVEMGSPLGKTKRADAQRHQGHVQRHGRLHGRAGRVA